MIQNLIFAVYLFLSDFLVEFPKPKKASRKDHSSYNTVSIKKPHSFYKP